MKLKSYLIFLSIFLATATLHAQNRKISVSVNNQPLKNVLYEIQNKSGYNIIYSDEVVTDSIRVSIQAVQEPVSEILKAILKDKRLYYVFKTNDLIVIGSVQLSATEQLAIANPKSVSGGVVDQHEHPIPFASVALLQGDRFITGVTSTDQGKFQLNFPFVNKHAYHLKLSSVGYKQASIGFLYPDTMGLKHLVLEEDRSTLNTVTISARKQFIERRSDRYIVNVEGSPLAEGNSALEVLQKAPGIWVDSEGGIKIKGNQSVMVMINDVVQRMSESDLADYLRSLKSQDIKKIEVISSPPSEFEASGTGGIIHIVLKKSRQDGLTGTASATYKQQEHKPYMGGGLSVDYKVKNLYVFGNGAYSQDKSEYYATTFNAYPDQSTYSGTTDRYNDNNRLSYRIGMAYDLSENQVIGLQGIHTGNDLLQYFRTRVVVDRPGQDLVMGNANSDWTRKPLMNGATLNYLLRLDSLGSVIKIIGDYVHSSKTELNDFTSVYNAPDRDSRYRNNTPNVTDIYSLQADYTKKIGTRTEFKTGVKYASTKRDNTFLSEDLVDGNWITNAGTSNRFVYNERLLMGYAALEHTIQNTIVKLGLRGEETYMKGNSITADQSFSRKYFGLFPSVYILQNLDKAKRTAIYFSYSRRLKRPQFSDLNPYRLHFDDYLVQTGNPDLLPEYAHKVELGYNFWEGWSVDVYYRRVENVISQLVNPIANNVIEYQPKNFNNSTDYGVNIDAPIRFFNWWNSSNSLVFYNLQTDINDFKINQFSFFLKSMQTISPKKLFDFDVLSMYSSPYVSANSKMGYVFYTDLGISKKILDNQLRLRFSITDIFNTAKEQDVTDYKNTRIDFYQKRPTRTFGLSLSYNFSSGKKFKNKKIEQSNEEEKSRIGN